MDEVNRRALSTQKLRSAAEPQPICELASIGSVRKFRSPQRHRDRRDSAEGSLSQGH
jgi:hypothetical protein